MNAQTSGRCPRSAPVWGHVRAISTTKHSSLLAALLHPGLGAPATNSHKNHEKRVDI